MRSSRSNLLAIGALALLGASAVPAPAPAVAQSSTDGARSTRTTVATGGTVGTGDTNSDARRGGLSEKEAWARRPWTTRRWKYLANDGWSVRQGQRMARKKRNQKRHRKACR
jgi:hypothetical protein